MEQLIKRLWVQSVLAAAQAKTSAKSAKGSDKQHGPPDSSKVGGSVVKDGLPHNSVVPATSLRALPASSHPHGAASAAGPSRTVASLPPRVGLTKGVKASASLHKSAPSGAPATGAVAASGSARSGSVAVGVKIVGAKGVRRPGLHKNGFVKQQLHARPDA